MYSMELWQCGTCLLISILGFFHRHRILFFFNFYYYSYYFYFTILYWFCHRHRILMTFPATLAVSSGPVSKCKWSAVWMCQERLLKRSWFTWPLPFVPVFFLWLGNRPQWLKPKQLLYDLEKCSYVLRTVEQKEVRWLDSWRQRSLLSSLDITGVCRL